MGLLRRKQAEPALARSASLSRLHSLPNEDLYLFVETSLMNAQQRLAEVRRVDLSARYVAIDMVVAELDAAGLGVQEMQARS